MKAMLKCCLVFLFHQAFATVQAEQTNKIFVVDEDKRPVAAEIFILVGKTSDRIGRTGADGCLTAEIGCKQGQRILVRPDDDAIYFQHNRTECPLQKETRIEMTKKATVNDLLVSAFEAQENGKHAAAAYSYNTLGMKAEAYDESAALTYRKASLESLGKQFSVKDAVSIKVTYIGTSLFPPRKVEVVSSENLKKEIKIFQSKNGLKGEGELDPETWMKIGMLNK